MRQLREAGSERDRQRWLKTELALVLAEATGRRLGSIRALEWDDIDFERATIRWSAEADKRAWNGNTDSIIAVGRAPQL